MPKTLLLADDSVTIQKVVALSFANEDIRLISVDNGDDALSQAREQRPDAVLADVVMPGLNGYELCEALQADPNLCSIPVLLLTGTFEAFDEERARRCGAAGQVAKPFEAQALLGRVRELLARPAPAAPPAAAPPPPESAVAAAGFPTDAPAGTDLAAELAADSEADAFDFFADESGDLAPRAPGDTAGDSLGVDADDAFSFGEDDDLPGLDSPQPARPAPGLDATVAILPEDDPGPEAPLLTATPVDDFGDETFGDREFATLASELVEAEDDDGVDLLDPEPVDLPALREPRPPAPATEPVFAPEPTPAPAPEPVRAAPEPLPAAPDPIPAAPATPAAPEPTAFAAEPDPFAPDPIPAAPDPQPLAFGADDDSLLRVDTRDLAQASLLDPGGAESFDVSSSDLAETDRAEAAAPAPAPAASPAPSMARPAPAAAPGPDLDALAPQLRAQVHDTLEKVAWESFGGLTEEIVRQVVERVEAIAWEVVPQMAETVIRETIRQMQRPERDDPEY